MFRPEIVKYEMEYCVVRPEHGLVAGPSFDLREMEQVVEECEEAGAMHAQILQREVGGWDLL